MNTALSMSTFLPNASASFTAAQSLFSLSQQACAVSRTPNLDPTSTRFYFTGTEPGRFTHVIAEHTELARNAASRLGTPDNPVAQIDTEFTVAGATKPFMHAHVGNEELPTFLNATPAGDTLVIISKAMDPEIWAFIEALSFDFSGVFAHGFSMLLAPDLTAMAHSIEIDKNAMRMPPYLNASRLAAIDSQSLIMPTLSIDPTEWQERTHGLIGFLHQQFMHPEITREASENVMAAIRTLGSALEYGGLNNAMSMLENYYLELLGPALRKVALAQK
jgi:hypothetical protein